MRRKGAWPISLNSPVIIGFALASALTLGADALTGGEAARFLAARYTSWADPLMYLRAVTHVAVHADFAHYTGNFLFILALGPLIEEKYGSRSLLGMLFVTALSTGLINVAFFRGTMLMGASGFVFTLILLASFTNVREGRLPVTVLLVGALYIGNEVVSGLTVSDDISRISHIVGALCGAGFGFALNAGGAGRASGPS
ncbi:MAG: rhomboid family intramembrane serine protease [Oscillospiraceae bacterium]|nr:rhomboid family intramembrane serine protease [Oscillospiraceae bacterium]